MKHSWPFLFVDDFHNKEAKSPYPSTHIED